MQHPHVVQFHYCLQTKSRIYLVMEYIRGGTLKSVLLKDKTLRPSPEVEPRRVHGACNAGVVALLDQDL